jgi:LmbE family N-acetylglucosaminyl deacetylase
MAIPADLAHQHQADDDLAAGATVTQFRAVLQGFPDTRPWGRPTPDAEMYAMTSPIQLSQPARCDLLGLYGRSEMPKILAALDQLGAVPTAGLTAWRHLDVGDYRVLYKPVPPSGPAPGYLIGAVTRRLAERGQAPRSKGPRPSSPGDDISTVRESETAQACAQLGVERVEFLRYQDSGMPGDPANHHPDAFARAEPDRAAVRAAAMAAEEHADAIVIYDAGGIYGHPDHIQVHHVGTRAARLAGVATIYESTVDRDYLRRAQVAHLVVDARQTLPPDLRLGVPAAMVSTEITVGAHLDTKRAAIAAHQSQVLTDSAVVTMPPDVFAHVYGHEWYIRRGPPGPLDPLTVPVRAQPRPATSA